MQYSSSISTTRCTAASSARCSAHFILGGTSFENGAKPSIPSDSSHYIYSEQPQRSAADVGYSSGISTTCCSAASTARCSAHPISQTVGDGRGARKQRIRCKRIAFAANFRASVHLHSGAMRTGGCAATLLVATEPPSQLTDGASAGGASSSADLVGRFRSRSREIEISLASRDPSEMAMRLGGCGAAFCIAKQHGQSCRATIAGRRGGGAPIPRYLVGRFRSRCRSFEIDPSASRALDFECANWQSSSSSTTARTAARLPSSTMAKWPLLSRLASWAAFEAACVALMHVSNRPHRQIRPRRLRKRAGDARGRHGGQTEGRHGVHSILGRWFRHAWPRMAFFSLPTKVLAAFSRRGHIFVTW
jgi:hypothetical protein